MSNLSALNSDCCDLPREIEVSANSEILVSLVALPGTSQDFETAQIHETKPDMPIKVENLSAYLSSSTLLMPTQSHTSVLII